MRIEQLDFTKYLPETMSLPTEQVVAELLSGKYQAEKLELVTHYIVHQNYQFSATELMELAKPIASVYPPELKILKGSNFASFFIACGYVFSVAELKMLGNPANYYGITIAHQMAYHGYKFNKSEIEALGNPKTHGGESLEDAYVPDTSISQSVRNEESKLIYRNGEPEFVIDVANIFGTKDGRRFEKTVEIGFGYYLMASDGSFLPENSFSLSLLRSESGWEVRLEGHERDMLSYLFQKILVVELVEKLNEAISKQQPFDFAGDISMFRKFVWPVRVEAYV